MNKELKEALEKVLTLKEKDETKEMILSNVQLKSFLIKHFGFAIERKVNPTLIYLEGMNITRRIPKTNNFILDFEKLKNHIDNA